MEDLENASPLVVGICGYARAGKDTAADYLSGLVCDSNKTSQKIALADCVRSMTRLLDPFFPELGCTYIEILAREGYENAKKHPCVRRFLIKMGNGSREVIHPDVWVNGLKLKLIDSTANVVFVSDVRYLNEVEYILSIGGMVIYVDNPRIGPICEEERKSIKIVLKNVSNLGSRFVKVKNEGSLQDYCDNLLKLAPMILPTEPSVKIQPKKKCYVAGSLNGQKLVNQVQEMVMKAGLEITYDWTGVEKATWDEHSEKRPSIKPEEYHEHLQKMGQLDLGGVLDCDIFVGVFEYPEYAYRGTCTELGIALGAGKEIYLLFVKDNLKETPYDQDSSYLRNPFLHLPFGRIKQRFTTLEDLDVTLRGFNNLESFQGERKI